MPAKFENHLLNIITVIIHACDIMFRFAIFVLEEIYHFWPSSLDRLLVRMRTSYGKSFTCSTGYIKVQMNTSWCPRILPLWRVSLLILLPWTKTRTNVRKSPRLPLNSAQEGKPRIIIPLFSELSFSYLFINVL